MNITKILQKLNCRKQNESVENGEYDFKTQTGEQPVVQESKVRPTLAELAARIRLASEKLTTHILSFEINVSHLPPELIKNLTGLRDQALLAAKNNNDLIVDRYSNQFKDLVNYESKIIPAIKVELIRGLAEDIEKLKR
jgi:hypothetical protein